MDKKESASLVMYQQKLEQLKLLQEKKRLEEGLPHLYGFPWYPWAREFFESTNRINLLLAGNQLSKSSTQIRKCIHWATEQSLWPSLWRNKPRQFWYLYPSSKQIEGEFETKWGQFLPQREFKEHPKYGWKTIRKNGEIRGLQFNSGITLYFKSYMQDSSVLQSATVDFMACDEEVPEELYPELIMRLTASNGYFCNVFTATLGQDFWRRAMEPADHEEETLPTAAKWRISMYDCQVYEDGTKTHWTNEHIQTVINRCGSEEEILKRVYGRFILAKGGRLYQEFDIKKHVKPSLPIPEDWHIYEGVDIGSGVNKTREGHLSAITFVAVNPTHTYGRVILGWRGDHEKTTAGSVLQKHFELKKILPKPPLLQFYDWASADFKTMSDNQAEPFIGADKSHEVGEQIINTLFKNGMLVIDDCDELRKLAIELTTLRKDTPKNKRRDDFADSFRYAVSKIPWDWSVIKGEKPSGLDLELKALLDPKAAEIKERRNAFFPGKEEYNWDVSEEIEEYNELYGTN